MLRTMVNCINKSVHSISEAGPYWTCHEIPMEFHGRVAFCQYIAIESGMYGVKFFWQTVKENE